MSIACSDLIYKILFTTSSILGKTRIPLAPHWSTSYRSFSLRCRHTTLRSSWPILMKDDPPQKQITNSRGYPMGNTTHDSYLTTHLTPGTKVRRPTEDLLSLSSFFTVTESLRYPFDSCPRTLDFQFCDSGGAPWSRFRRLLLSRDSTQNFLCLFQNTVLPHLSLKSVFLSLVSILCRSTLSLQNRWGDLRVSYLKL